MVAVYRTLSDCQAQICSSVSGPAASAYKGRSWSRGKEEYFSARGLSNATYVINAAELSEDILGPLVPCSFQEIVNSHSNQLAPHHIGFHDGTTSQTGPQYVDLNHEAISSSSRHISPANFNHSGAVDAQPISRQYMMGILHFDGASKGNPGKAGAGAVLMSEDGRVISRLREGLGVVTNNVAEYRGLILGLKYAIRHGFKKIKVHGDSQLVCHQVNGVWQTKHQNMMELCNEVRRLKQNFHSFEISHVRREWNAEADRQANIGITLASGTVSEERGDF